MKRSNPPREIESLRATVRTQLLAMLLLIAALGGLVVWAHDFVLKGFQTNPYLNGLIFAVFGYGVFHVFRRLYSVRNDATAFSALQEAYADARKERTETIEDPYWRHYRAMQPGILFSSPRSVGRIFEMAYDELLRTRNLKISANTLQSVAQGIESRLTEERSQIGYLSGLLVFLGLIGTFIGLMEMVGSIGGLIGSLDTVNANSGEAIRKLFSNLRQPLDGMATGFSSSLFGLFGSLVLGLLGRFGGRAINVQRHSFENWLTNVAQLEGIKGTGEVGDLARLISDNLLGKPTGESGSQTGLAQAGGTLAPMGGTTDLGMIAGMAQGFARMNQGIEQMAAIMPRLLDSTMEQVTLSRAVLAGIDRMVSETSEMREASNAVVAAANTSTEHQQEMINLTRMTESRLTSGFNGMAHIMEVTGQAYLDGLRRLTAENYETNARLAKLLDVKAAGDRITEIAGAIETKVKAGMGNMSTSLDRTATAIETTMQKMITEQAELRQVLSTLSGGGAGNGQVGISPEFEDKLTQGFSDLSRSIETVFTTFSTMISRGLMREMAQGVEPAASMPMASPAPSLALPEHEMRAPQKIEVDHDVMRRKLYDMAAAQRRNTGS